MLVDFGPDLNTAPTDEWGCLSKLNTCSVPGLARIFRALDVEPEVHDVALADDVVLALEAQLAGLLRALLTVERDVVVVGDDLGADEALLEVRVDLAGRLRRERPGTAGPVARFLGARCEKR